MPIPNLCPETQHLLNVRYQNLFRANSIKIPSTASASTRNKAVLPTQGFSFSIGWSVFYLLWDVGKAAGAIAGHSQGCLCVVCILHPFSPHPYLTECKPAARCFCERRKPRLKSVAVTFQSCGEEESKDQWNSWEREESLY